MLEWSWIKGRWRSGRSGGRDGEAKGTDAGVEDVGVGVVLKDGGGVAGVVVAMEKRKGPARGWRMLESWIKGRWRSGGGCGKEMGIGWRFAEGGTN
jgi:hypothetical protein